MKTLTNRKRRRENIITWVLAVVAGIAIIITLVR